MSAEKRSDVIVIGAGLAGIACAHHVLQRNPYLTLKILEQRGAVGGTWDLFTYPGLRSDSDIHTYGFSFNRWQGDEALASGTELKEYISRTWQKSTLDKRTEFHKSLRKAAWSSEQALWTLTVKDGLDKSELRYECRFLLMCTGFFEYERGYTPDFENMDDYQGTIIHPQSWDTGLDYAGKRIVVIGSGATAVTLVPTLAQKAKHVTMLQRSATYLLARPRMDSVAKVLNSLLPTRAASWLSRWRNALLTALYFRYCRLFPQRSAKGLIDAAHSAMGGTLPKEDLTPPYMPWDQRVCAVQDGDLFEHVADGKVSIVTNEIERFTPTGLRLQDGADLEADIIVTATGFNIRLMGGADIVVDGSLVNFADTTLYRDTMYAGVPNLASTSGYFNGSWTLKVELQAQLVARVIERLTNGGWDKCEPHATNVLPGAAPYFKPGYVVRRAHMFPKHGGNSPWRGYQNFPFDIFSYRFCRLDQPSLQFSNTAHPGGPR